MEGEKKKQLPGRNGGGKLVEQKKKKKKPQSWKLRKNVGIKRIVLAS